MMLTMALVIAGLVILTASPVIVVLFISWSRAWITKERFTEVLTNDLYEIAFYASKNARKFLVLVVGMSLLIIGVAMMVLPGPATVVIPLALALLGTEFVWARRVLKYILDSAKSAAQHLTGTGDSG